MMSNWTDKGMSLLEGNEMTVSCIHSQICQSLTASPSLHLPLLPQREGLSEGAFKVGFLPCALLEGRWKLIASSHSLWERVVTAVWYLHTHKDIKIHLFCLRNRYIIKAAVASLVSHNPSEGGTWTRIENHFVTRLVEWLFVSLSV